MYSPYPPMAMPGGYAPYPAPMMPAMVGPYYPPAGMMPYGMPVTPAMVQPVYPAMTNAVPAPAYRPVVPVTAMSAPAPAAPRGPAPFITGYVTGASPAPNCPQPATPAPAAPAPAAPAPPARKKDEKADKKDERADTAPAQDQLPSTLPSQNALAQAPEAGTEAAPSYAPNMIGDLIGYTGLRSIRGGRSSSSSDLYLPLTQFGTFKISENESPRPQTRVFGTYSYFNNVDGSINGHPAPSVDVHRETTGFEYAFWGGNASVGMRVPFVQTRGDQGIDDSQVGDLSIILKGALYNNCKTHSVLSAGLVVTVPTGGGFNTFDGLKINPTLLQPWLGGILDLDRFYIHGFTGGVAPTDLHVPVLVDADLGIGFWLYRCNGKHFLTGIVPTVEGHANIPVSNRGIRNDPVGFPDEGVVTGGMHFIFCRRATLTLGASVPLTGPQPYDIEGEAQFNFRF
jgi:hypothetical protein